jgi:hypothetical protein
MLTRGRDDSVILFIDLWLDCQRDCEVYERREKGLVMKDGYYQTDAGSCLNIVNGNARNIKFDWFEEPAACCECSIETVEGRRLLWTCSECDGGSAELRLKEDSTMTEQERYMEYQNSLSDEQRKIQEQATRIKELEEAINKCLVDNGHLADGDVCTLIDLKRVLKQRADA